MPEEHSVLRGDNLGAAQGPAQARRRVGAVGRVQQFQVHGKTPSGKLEARVLPLLRGGKVQHRPAPVPLPAADAPVFPRHRNQDEGKVGCFGFVLERGDQIAFVNLLKLKKSFTS